MKISVLLSTLFSQMVTFTTGASFDPKIHSLNGLNGTQIDVQRQDNEYEVKIYAFLENSPIKKWFMPRHSSCVVTIVQISEEFFVISSRPQPFGETCVNDLEWVLLGCVPALALGVASLVFLVRKVTYNSLMPFKTFTN